MRNSLSYEELSISPFKLISLIDLNIEKKINEHGKLCLKGVISEEDKDVYINSVNTQIEIKDKENNKAIFVGKVIELKINLVHGVHYLEAEALSNTYELDIKLNKRSFQHMDTRSVVNKVLEGYNGTLYNRFQGTLVQFFFNIMKQIGNF